MTRDIRAYGVSVGETEDNLEPAVHLFVLKDGAVNRVVGDDGAKPRPNTCSDK